MVRALNSTRSGSPGRRTYSETGIARALDARKQRLAPGRPPYSPPSLEEISSRLEAMIVARLGRAFRVSNLRHLTGGASKAALRVRSRGDWSANAVCGAAG